MQKILLIKLDFYPTLANYFEDLAENNAPKDEIHHYIMLKYDNIIDKMALTLNEMFNGAANGLTVEHFKMVAANGLFTVMENHQAPDYPTHLTLSGYFQDKYKNLGAVHTIT